MRPMTLDQTSAQPWIRRATYESRPLLPQEQLGPRLVGGALNRDDRARGAVLLLGNFDGFHLGHRTLLAAARQVAGPARPLAIMSCEPHPRSFFCAASAPFRLTTPASKLRLFAPYGFEYVYAPRFDAAFAGFEPDEFAEDILSNGLGVAHVVAGEDFRFGRARAGDLDLLARLGARLGFGVMSVAEVSFGGARCSSTAIRKLVSEGQMAEVGQALGSPWLIETTTDLRGNMQLHSGLCRPAPGLYHANAEGGRRWTRGTIVEIDVTGKISIVDRESCATDHTSRFWRLIRRIS